MCPHYLNEHWYFNVCSSHYFNCAFISQITVMKIGTSRNSPASYTLYGIEESDYYLDHLYNYIIVHFQLTILTLLFSSSSEASSNAATCCLFLENCSSTSVHTSSSSSMLQHSSTWSYTDHELHRQYKYDKKHKQSMCHCAEIKGVGEVPNFLPPSPRMKHC